MQGKHFGLRGVPCPACRRRFPDSDFSAGGPSTLVCGGCKAIYSRRDLSRRCRHESGCMKRATALCRVGGRWQSRCVAHAAGDARIDLLAPERPEGPPRAAKRTEALASMRHINRTQRLGLDDA